MEPTRNSGCDRFVELRLLGEGAIGDVFALEERNSGVRYAWKTLRGAADGHARLSHELQLIKRVAHANVVHGVALIEHARKLGLLMELVSGVDFVSYVRKSHAAPSQVYATCTGSAFDHGQLRARAYDGRCDEARLRAALEQLADGLNAVHAAGIVHCDIKPENVLVTREGRVVIVDFGSAGHVTQLSAPLHGTPGFMAPEMHCGALSEAADWYAVGVLLYCALTGRLPLGGESIGPLAQHGAIDPRLFTSDLPDDLVDLTMHLLEPDPRARARGSDVVRLLRSAQRRSRRARAVSAFRMRASLADPHPLLFRCT